MATFELQFESSKIKAYAEAYSYGGGDDSLPLAAGKRIASGEYRRANLEAIVRWKTKGRGATRLEANSEDEIEEALRVASTARTDRAAVAVLVALEGIKLPVSSAILTMIHPDRFTILDVRALEALGCRSKSHTVKSYLAYLAACRRIAKENGVTLRALDRALWEWSKQKSQAKSRAHADRGPRSRGVSEDVEVS